MIQNSHHKKYLICLMDRKLFNIIKENPSQLYEYVSANKIDVDVKIKGNALIHYAVLLHDLDLLNYIIENHGNLRVKNKQGIAPLNLSVHLNHHDMFEIIILHDPNNDILKNIFHNTKYLKSCVGIIDLNHSFSLNSKQNSNVLGHNIRLLPHTPKQVSKILKRCAFLQVHCNPNIPKSNPVIMTIIKVYYNSASNISLRTKLLRFTRKLNFDPNIYNCNDKTPLMITVYNSIPELTKVLLDKKADPNIHKKANDSVIIIAINRLKYLVNTKSKTKLEQHYRVLKLLLEHKEHKIDLSVTDSNLNTPLQSLLEINNPPKKFKTLIIKVAKNTKNLGNINIFNKIAYDQAPTDLKKILLKPSKEFCSYKTTSKIKKCSKIPKVKLMMPPHTNHSLFVSNHMNQYLLHRIMINKHKMFYAKNIYEIDSTFSNSEPSLLTKKSYESYNQIDPTFVSNIMFWYNSKNYSFMRISKFIEKFKKSKKSSFCIFLAILDSRINHANILLYTHDNKTLERFDPYGYINSNIHQESVLDSIIRKRFKSLHSEFQYITPKQTMGKYGFQTLSNEHLNSNKKHGDPTGFCVIWCYWYLETRMQNSKYEVQTILKSVIYTIGNSQYTIMEYIRNVSNHFHELIRTFLIKKGVDKRKINNVDNSEIIKVL